MRGMSIMERASVKIIAPSQLPAHQDRSFQNLMGAIERSKIEVPELSAAALRDVLKGVITGEGPPVDDRVHFSRTLEPDDASLCARILTAARGKSGPRVPQLAPKCVLDL